MVVNDIINLLHYTNSLDNGDDDLVIVGEVVLREQTAFSAPKPLLADWITANTEIPYSLRHTFETFGFFLINPHSLIGIGYPLNLWIPATNELGDIFIKSRRFQ